jgi:putative FmdB family regulatory protein
MPTYEYICQKCGKFEDFQGISEAPLSACPTCGSTVKRTISPGAGLIFKGSGFYITDYRKPEYREKAKADSAGSGATASESTKTEGKADSAAEKSGNDKPSGVSGGNSKPASDSQ